MFILSGMRSLLALAVLPSLVLMGYIYRKDRVDKEPLLLLLALAFFGALSCYPAGWLEGIAMRLLDASLSPSAGMLYTFFEAFFCIALVEELVKFWVLRTISWEMPYFNCTFDGIVYSVFVSLGFAALENVMYLFSFGPGVLFNRAILSIPGHMTFAVFMGLFYSRARRSRAYGRPAGVKGNCVMAVLSATALHGFFDFCLMSGSDLLYLLFFGFVVLLDIAAFSVVRRESLLDVPIDGWRFN